MPDIHAYDDYREFLLDWLDEQPRRSTELLARRIGCAKSYVSMVSRGARDLPTGRAPLWAHALQLDEESAGYWCLMVQEADASAPDLQDEARTRRRAARAWRRALAERPDTRVFGSWLHQTVLELARCPGCRADPAWIGERLRPPADPTRVQATLDDLGSLGLVRIEGDHLVATGGSIATPPTIEESALRRLATQAHLDLLDRADVALRAPASDASHVSALTFAISRDRIPTLLAALTRLQIQCLEDLADVAPDQVFQLGLVLIPCTAPVESP